MLNKIYDKNNVIVYEQPPTKRSMPCGNGMLFIQFPYLYFFIKKSKISEFLFGNKEPYSLYVYGSNQKINNFDEKSLGNFQAFSGKICTSNFYSNINLFLYIFWNKNLPIKLISYYWQSQWRYIVCPLKSLDVPLKSLFPFSSDYGSVKKIIQDISN